MSAAVTGISGRMADTGGPLQGLCGLVLLAGSVRPTRLSASIGRHVLDLPLEENLTVLGYWCAEAAAVAARLGIERLPVLALLDRAAPGLSLPPGEARVEVNVLRDSLEYRGTGGLVRDLAVERSPDSYLLVANAAQVLYEPLIDLAQAMAAPRADVAVFAQADGAPTGLMLVRCGAMSEVPAVGYVDMKEQALPEASRRHDVRVVRHDRVTAVPMRSRSDYIAALRVRHGAQLAQNPFAEHWQPAFRIVEPGAEVEDGAQLLDSVVLRGGRVGRGAIVARSVICAGGRVAAGAQVVDEVISGAAAARRAGLL